MQTVFLLEHQYEDDGHEDAKTIGIYSSLKNAEDAKKRKLKYPGFKKYPRWGSLSQKSK